MHSLPASALLAVWEQGAAQTTPERALALLAAAFPGTATDALARLPIGRRDACLLALRERTFGPHLESRAACPACSESLEIEFSIADVRVPLPGPSGDGPGGAPAQQDGEKAELWFETAGYRVQYRLPNSLDLAALAHRPGLDPSLLRQALLERCVLSVECREPGETPVPARDLPAEVTRALADQMAEADPQANIRLALDCPSCGQHWTARFDILSFFWQEIDVWACRLLHEVHVLASAYGWREPDILALSPARRQIYLDMVRGGRAT